MPPGGIRTHDLSERAAADLRLRPRSYWDRPLLFLLYLNIVLNWPEDGRLRPKHVVKYNLTVIIASCLDVCRVLPVHNILYKFDNTQRDGLSQKNST